MERKLAAILSADVKGYSRLMGDNEEATIRTLTAYREVMSTLIQQHRGRVVDSPGDNLLAEFASAIDAVQGAVAIQRELQAKNAALPDARKMEYRIGINVGDVIVEGARLYGDGVNIAARLEGLAAAGGICVAGTVYDQVKTKLALRYDYLGEQAVKNIAEPVRVWRVAEPGGAPPLARIDQKKQPTYKQRAALAAVLVLVVGIAGGVLRYLFSPRSSPVGVSSDKAAALPLPDKPSIAVLPFVNMSDDPQQDYFSDGITEDLITDLSRLSGVLVISRNSVFTYKGKALKVAEVSKELGVRYVLEGSVRKADKQVRITAQLVDATTDSHIWAERYDRPLHAIFALQDEIVQKIVTTLKLQLTLQEQGILVRKTTANLEAYDAYLRGVEAFNRYTKEANAQARQLLESAIARDPQFAAAYALLGWVYYVEWFSHWSQDPQISLHQRPSAEPAYELARQALARDDSLPEAHHLVGYDYMYQKQHERAIAEMERAITLSANDAGSYASLSAALMYAGRPEEAMEVVRKALRLNPHPPPFYWSFLGQAYRLTGRYEDAIPVLKRASALNPNFLLDHFNLAVTYRELGREGEARAEVAELLRLSPTLSVEGLRQSLPYKDPAILERALTALRKAGLK
jgi:adenylate cyclase